MDLELAKRFCSGDHEAFAKLYDRYAPLVRAICYRTTGRVCDSQDLAQEVFRRAWTGRERLRDPDTFSAWLIGISKRVCLEWCRKHQRDRHTYVDTQQIKVSAPQNQACDDAIAEVHEALLKLPESERMAVDLFYLQDEPAESVRALVGLSRSGFYKLLERARNRLRDLLRDQLEPKS